jgi:uncharacterized membrane protein
VLLTYAVFFLIGGVLPPLFIKCGLPVTEDWLYEVFSASCQQQPSRTFWMLGYPMALCARCCGAYLGFAGCAFYCAAYRKVIRFPTSALYGLALFALGEKAGEWIGSWPGNNSLRFIAGCALGALVFLVVHFLLVVVIKRVKHYATHYKTRLGL